MLGRPKDERVWKPWLRNSLKNFRPSYPSERNVDGGPKALVLFVRILHGDKSEMCTLRELHDGMKVYQIKAELELLSGIPTCMMDLHSLQDKSFYDDDVLIQGKNVSFGDTIRVKLNNSWNELMHSVWQGSLSGVQRFCKTLDKRAHSPIAFPSPDVSVTKEVERENILSQALFVACRRGNEKICKFLLRKGASTTFMTSLGNISVHTAACAGHLTIIQLLVSYGSNVRCRNMQGKSPLEVAVNRGHFDCARWLWLNQWSLSITKDIMEQPGQTPSRPTKPSKIFLTPTYTSDLKPLPKEVSHRARTPSPRSTRERTPSNWLQNRPQTAYVLGQYRHQSLPEPVILRRSTSASTKSSAPKHNESVQINKRASALSFQSEKSKQIVNFFTSRRDRQQSIPSRTFAIPAEVINSEMRTTKLEARRLTVFDDMGQKKSRHHSTTVSTWRPSTASFEEGRKKSDQEIVVNRDRNVIRETEFLCPETVSKSESGRVIEELEFNEQTSTELTQEIVPNRETPVPPPPSSLVSDVTTHTEDGEKPESPMLPQEETKRDVLTIPTSGFSESDINSEHSDEQNATLYQNSFQYDTEPSSVASQSPFHVSDPKDSNDFSITPPFAEESDVSHSNLQNDSTENIRISKTVRFETKDANEANLDTQWTEKILDVPDDHHLENNSTVRNSGKSSTEDFHQKAKPDEVAQTTGRKPSVRFHDNSPHKHESNFTRKSFEYKRPSSAGQLHASPRNSRTESKDKSSKEDDQERIEKNRKAFEIWLNKKRKSQSKQKEEESARLARFEQKQSIAHRTSIGMTFDEWLQMKEEEGELEPLHEEHKTPEKIKKREIKYQKTFEDWRREKEEEQRLELERRKSMEAQQRLKEEQEREMRKREYDRKMEAWKKKKEEMKRNELERKRMMEQMAMKSAHHMYEEWQSKPRVKSFEEWKQSKAEDERLSQVANAQKEIIAEQEKEMEERRHEKAKEKFQLWVMKKDLGKLKATELDLENVRKRRKSRHEITKEKFQLWVMKKDLGKLKANELEQEQERKIRKSLTIFIPHHDEAEESDKDSVQYSAS